VLWVLLRPFLRARGIRERSAPADPGVTFSTPRYGSDEERLAAEALPCRVLALYVIGRVADPGAEASRHRAWCRKRSIVGRVWICKDGINVQVSGRTFECKAYASFVASRLATQQPLLCRLDPVPEPAFPRLRVKAKKLVSLAPGLEEDIDLADRGEDLEPVAWLEELRALSAGAPARLLDVRNTYEWELGRFSGAMRPATEEFAEATLESLGLTEADKDIPLLLYCTGGIRCEFVGAALRRRGFHHVRKLRGGIQHYGNALGAEGWEGRLFVFDRRNTVPVGAQGEAAPGGRCGSCGEKCLEEFWNCANVDCNRRLVACRRCMEANRGCCCAACARAPRRVRPPAGRRGAAALSWIQGPAPGMPDPNRLWQQGQTGVSPCEPHASEVIDVASCDVR